MAQAEPLPDIDFNILAGNTLVGYATLEEVEKAKAKKFDFGGIVDRVRSVDRNIRSFRELQTQHGFDPQHFRESKANLQAELCEVEAELNKDLADEYGAQDPDAFIASHKPFHWYVELNDIIQHGGFDVIIGNPPYLEMNQIDYEVRGYECGPRGPVHSLCVERSTVLLRHGGRASMIMPLSLVSTQRMRNVQNVLERGKCVWYSNYSWRPAKLFDKVNRAFTIFLVGPDRTVRVYATHYRKWHSETREWLMPLVRYAEVPGNMPHWWVPKLHRGVETSILQKLFDIDTTVDTWTGDTESYIYYRTTGGLYWKVFTDFAPAFFVNGKESHSSRETTLSVVRTEYVRPVIALLSSSLFWWWYTITTNCRDLNPSDIKCLPVTESVLNDHRLVELGGEYLDDLRRNSHMHVRDQRQTGRTETQLFKVQKSKPIIDSIDRVLAEHYGFTDQELDFIMNYDIKYRMGGAEEG